MDRVTFVDKDMAGEATIKEGEKEVHIEFENPFIFTPIVTITPQDAFGYFALENVTKRGFTIIIEQEAQSNMKFTWMAISIANSEKSNE